MRITKKLIERCTMALIMALPVGYLFVTQIFALAGAHGEEVLAEMPYQEEWIETTDFQTGEDFKFVFYETFSNTFPTPSDNYMFSLNCNGATFYGIRIGNIGTSQTQYIAYLQEDNISTPFAMGVHRNSELGWSGYPYNATIYFISSSLPNLSLLNYGTLYYKNPVQNTNYRDSLFNNIFGQSNFLTDWGNDVLSDNPHGFAPFASMIKYLDVNMLHLGEKNYGLMAYGQLYYMLNVSIFFLIYKTMVFIPNIITRAFEWFRKENNEND